MNHDNINSHLVRTYVETKTSPKTGNEYTVLVLIFNKANGKEYKFTTFLNDDQKSIIEDTVSIAGQNQL
jgi:hypothetical protein